MFPQIILKFCFLSDAHQMGQSFLTDVREVGLGRGSGGEEEQEQEVGHGRCVRPRSPIACSTSCLWSQCIFLKYHMRTYSSTASRCPPARLLRRPCSPPPQSLMFQCDHVNAPLHVIEAATARLHLPRGYDVEHEQARSPSSAPTCACRFGPLSCSALPSAARRRQAIRWRLRLPARVWTRGRRGAGVHVSWCA